ncbi:MAG TPA: hypothetical protein VNZ53_58825 [Steroidobacteraceae bacterium]|jgi:hypothetical protein|nr:hypothetical protein [Steroidobacteraceae bacterium]
MDGNREFHDVFAPSSALGLIARALRDPVLHEQSIRIHSPELNELQPIDIASHYVECGDAAGALRWLGHPFAPNNEYQRLALLDSAYALLGDRARQLDVRREQYRRAPGIHTYRALEEIISSSRTGPTYSSRNMTSRLWKLRLNSVGSSLRRSATIFIQVEIFYCILRLVDPGARAPDSWIIQPDVPEGP